VSNKQPTSSSKEPLTTQRTIDWTELFDERREVSIRFRGDVYRLRITRNDKLILTK